MRSTGRACDFGVIETERLLLRVWRPDDAKALDAIRSDPRVVATLGTPADPPATVIERQTARLQAHGYCFWAAELRVDAQLTGWCGIQPGFAPLAGKTEIGWMVAPDLWGRGLAREAAAAVLAWTWANTALDHVVAITTPGNTRSWGLMERLGMRRVPGGEFDHPALAEGHPLRRHFTYRIERPR
ncbi:GNAT family N-acetyltransferase [uncultured Sphingomonas sp.]|uniref:GNAT family N-acetyltransferase n=1 Tax=uncultured Sphingomonas sp. TaxID=158754 RepID=UPI0035CACEC2